MIENNGTFCVNSYRKSLRFPLAVFLNSGKSLTNTLHISAKLTQTSESLAFLGLVVISGCKTPGGGGTHIFFRTGTCR